ncbi:MAG: hypothetical protein OJF47_000869 [Nitrospira sp.]|jgi:hypothetical protein|nr:MAG: hypothetical protein OJF47_000869 [Nitrospira sp.]
MAQRVTSADLIRKALSQHPGCSMDELVTVCPTLTWNQIFLEVDRLSRAGHLRLMLSGPGRYTLVLPTERKSCTRQWSDAPARLPVTTPSRYDTVCNRCGGLMVSDREDKFIEWRCILCGERIDSMLLTQRRRSESAYLGTVHAGR